MSHYGPGTGTLIGLAWGERANQRDHEVERERLRRALLDANEALMAAAASKNASKAVLNAIITELQDQANGRLLQRRLSDPANVAGRNLAFMATAEGELNRLSGGTLGFTAATHLAVTKCQSDIGVPMKMFPDKSRVRLKVQQKRAKNTGTKRKPL